MVEPRTCTADTVFRAFTRCEGDPYTLLVDLRPYKEFSKRHISLSYCVRLTSNGQALIDYSKNEYDIKWTTGVWWGKPVIVFGPDNLKKDHPVVTFLAKEGKAAAINVYPHGFESLEKLFPFLVTASVKGGSSRRYPSYVEPGLYLGDWSQAEATEKLRELGINGIVTIHNNPERLATPRGMDHLRIELADIATADIARWFDVVADFEETLHRKHGQSAGLLIHCGAGVSRSATLAMSLLMRHHNWPAERALRAVRSARSIITPNDGFWRSLCALERWLGLPPTSDTELFAGTAGRDARGFSSADKETKIRTDFVASDLQQEDRPRSRDDRRGRRSRSRDREYVQSNGLSDDTITFTVTRDTESLGELRIVLPAGGTARCVFGRLPSCDVTLEHMSISRQHAQLTRDAQGTVFLTDLGSGHGTNLDGIWLRPQKPHVVKHGSVIQFGASTRSYKVV